MMRRGTRRVCAPAHPQRAFSLVAPTRSQLLTLSQLMPGSDGRSLPTVSPTLTGPSVPGAGLQIQLPPLVAWPTRLPELRPTIEAYLAALRDGRTAGGGGGAGHPQGPLFLSLRLFPDASLAALENRPAAPLSLEEEHAQQQQHSASAKASATERRGPTPLQRIPLSAFLYRDQQPWGTSLDPEQVFKRALDGLEYLCTPLACRVPVVLIVPTRLMVSQSFCERLFSRAAASGVSTIAFELPSTATLLERETPAEREAFGRVPAVSQRWHRLSPLCTDWADLTRRPVFRPLLSASRHQVMPLHVLLPWLRARGMLDGAEMELGLAVDTTPPRTRYARRRARLEGPTFLLDDDAQKTLAYADEDVADLSGTASSSSSSSSPSLRPSSADGRPTDEDVDVMATDKTSHHCYMRSPLDTALTRSWHVTPPSREEDGADKGAASHTTSNSSSSSSSSSSSAWSATARVAETALRTRRTDPSAAPRDVSASARPSGGSDLSAGLSLGPMPDDVKALILRSLHAESDQPADGAATAPSPAEAGRALFARLSGAAASASSGVTPTGGSTLEDELAFLQRRTHVPARTDTADALLAAVLGETHSAAPLREAPPASSSGFGAGYWQCLRCLALRVVPSAFCLTMPTLNAAQAQAWRDDLERPRAPQQTPCPMPFVPVLLPVLSPAALEAQRLLREGPRGRAARTEAGESGQGVLGPVDGPLAALVYAEATQGKPPRSVFRALAAQRASLVDDASPGQATVQAGGTEEEEGEEDAPLVIRPRRRRGSALRPLEYVPPAFVSAHDGSLAEAARGEAAAQCRSQELAFVQETLTPALHDAAMRLRHGHAKTAASETASAGTLVALCVPSPGLETRALLSSWDALFP